LAAVGYPYHGATTGEDAMVWLGGPRRGGGRARPIVLHDPPPGYRPPRMPAKFLQQQLRSDYILMRVTIVVLALLAVAFIVIIFVMIATYI
jgi:hypothetical protein